MAVRLDGLRVTTDEGVGIPNELQQDCISRIESPRVFERRERTIPIAEVAVYEAFPGPQHGVIWCALQAEVELVQRCAEVTADVGLVQAVDTASVIAHARREVRLRQARCEPERH